VPHEEIENVETAFGFESSHTKFIGEHFEQVTMKRRSKVHLMHLTLRRRGALKLVRWHFHHG
jgi:hypothetical protein